MFDRISGVYDLMNAVMTAGLHHRWRERAIALAAFRSGDRVLDVATGPAISRPRRWRRSGRAARWLAMTSRRRCSRARARKVPAARFEIADALALLFRRSRVDAATVGFGARNFADLERGIAELVRVTRSGGRVVILEITQPTRQPLASFYRAWFDRVVPALGTLAGDRPPTATCQARYAASPGRRQLARLLDEQGLEAIRYVLTAGGIIAIHVGVVR